MTVARSQLVDVNVTAWYHIISKNGPRSHSAGRRPNLANLNGCPAWGEPAGSIEGGGGSGERYAQGVF
jgi:hypothetical protein